VADYNPVAYLIMKSILEYAPKYGTQLEIDVKKYGKEWIELTRQELGKFFVRGGKKSLAYIWMWCIKCKYCQQRIPLTNHMWLVNNSKRKTGIRFTPTEDKNFKVELIKDMDNKEGNGFTQKGGKAICIRCRNSLDYVHITSDIAKNHDREMIAVVVQGHARKEYELVSSEDKINYIESKKHLEHLWNEYAISGLIPSEEIKASHRRENPLWHYGIRTWDQFFLERQLLVTITLLKNIPRICKDIRHNEYARVIATFLAFSLCRHVDRNSIGISWQPTGEFLGHALSFRRPTILYNFAETNPFEKTSGSLIGILNDSINSIKFAATSKNLCQTSLNSVLKLSEDYDHKFDLIITDPPYADDVQYGELSDFFYVWLYRALREFAPELKPMILLEEDISVSWGRFGTLELAKAFYKKAIKQAFKQIEKTLKDDGLMIVFFSHSSTEAWNLLLEVLREARFKVVSSYAIHTENITNPLATGKTSFMSSIIVACRKILKESITYFEDLLPVIEDKVKNMISNLTLEELLDLPMTDLLIMTYGKVLEETTQHVILKSYRSDFKPEFENLIKDARDFILKEIVTKLTGRSPNMLGSDASFYIVTKVFYRGILDSNEALKVAWAYQLNLEELGRKQVVRKESGNTKLMFFDEISFENKPDGIDRNNLHQQLLYLEGVADREGVSGVKRVASQSNNFRIEDLKKIINLLIKSYRMRLNKKETLVGKEQKELEILEGLADMLNLSMPTGRNTLEEFMG